MTDVRVGAGLYVFMAVSPTDTQGNVLTHSSVSNKSVH